jgi:DNA-binding SARP family transcriptional activator
MIACVGFDCSSSAGIGFRKADMERYQTSAMLNRALAGLYPESFYHPIWRHYSNEESNHSAELIQKLIQSAEQLASSGDTHNACQILLICAVLQSRGNNLPVALLTAQQAWELAENHNLEQASNWSAWGVCALCVNKGDYQTAVSLLRWLQIKLRQEGQWILANHLELIKTTLCSESQAGGYFEIISDIFSCWGEPGPAMEAISRVSSPKEQTLEQRHSLPSKTVWQGLMGTLKKAFSLRSVTRGYRRAEEHGQANVQDTILSPADALPVKRRITKVNTFSEKTSQAARQKVKTGEVTGDYSKPILTVHLLGVFRVALNDQPIVTFPHGQGRAIFEYLVFHHHQFVPREVLMDLFWPEADPASARNSLNVAFYTIRKALRTVMDFPVVLFVDGAYGLNPEMDIWIDVEEFDNNIDLAHMLESEGEMNKAKVKLEIAANLYQGDFLAEDLYEEWAIYTRERLRAQYLDTISRLCRIYYHQSQYTACAALCQLILKYDSCDEQAHCRLMRCYGRQNQYHLAIRQYHICADALHSELGIAPAPRTVKLYERARRREHTQPLKLHLI